MVLEIADIAVHGPLQWQPPPVIDALAGAVVDAAIAGVRGTDAAVGSVAEKGAALP